jgi:hypothetical protein
MRVPLCYIFKKYTYFIEVKLQLKTQTQITMFVNKIPNFTGFDHGSISRDSAAKIRSGRYLDIHI